jgi:hypothetical protein
MKHLCIPTARMVYSHHDVLACKQSVAREAQSQVNVADFRYIGNGSGPSERNPPTSEHASGQLCKGYAHKAVGNIPTSSKLESADILRPCSRCRGAVLKSWTDACGGDLILIH